MRPFFVTRTTARVKWGKFANRNGHSTLQRKFLAMVLDMLPGVVALVFSQEQKGLTAAIWLQLLKLPGREENENVGFPGFGWVNKTGKDSLCF